MLKKNWVKISVVMVFVASIILFFVMENLMGRDGDFVFMPMGDAVVFDVGAGASIHATGGRGFFVVTRNGITYRRDDGRVLMNESFNITNPIIQGAGEVVGVFGHGGYQVRVYNTRGLMYHLHLENPVINLSINPQGFISVVTRSGSVYESFLYDPQGRLVLSNRESTNIVIATAISPDGRIWAQAFLDISGLVRNSYISFRYIRREDGLRYTDSTFATVFGENISELSGQFFGSLDFIDGNNLIVVTESSVFKLDMAQPSRPRWVIPFSNEVTAFTANGSYIAFAYGRGRLNMPEEPFGRVELYNLDGVRVFYHDTNARVTGLYMSQLGLIIGNGRFFTALDHIGEELWYFEADADAREAVFMDNAGKIVLHTNSRATVLRRVRITGN
ncbi:MAG: DUF5711 family protein [Defluviitaleaceae bacterium]|nr:DUF5711 family protein [Defluviitaleaceae bacterium]